MKKSLAAERPEDELTGTAAADAMRRLLLDATTLAVPDPYLRAAVLFESVEVVGSHVLMTFAVVQVPEGAANPPKFRCPAYRSVRIAMPLAQALSLRGALDRALL